MDSHGKEHVVTLLSLPNWAWTWSGLFRLFFLPLNYVHCYVDRCCQNALKCFCFAMQGKVIVTQSFGNKGGVQDLLWGNQIFLIAEMTTVFFFKKQQVNAFFNRRFHKWLKLVYVCFWATCKSWLIVHWEMLVRAEKLHNPFKHRKEIWMQK